jgi:ABC-2 type transport system ATP-binding protein
VLTTHDLEEAERLSDRIGIVDRGKLVAEGTVAELLQTANAATLEDAFMTLTGHRLDDADQKAEARE